MKTISLTILTAALLGIASLAGGRPFDAADFIAILFTTGLVAWTLSQYGRTPRTLMVDRPIRLSLVNRPGCMIPQRQRHAA